VIDVITNSSTEIYSWYDNSVGACKEMLQEMLKVFGVDKNVDDVFYITISCDVYGYIDYIDNMTDSEYKVFGELFPDMPTEYKEKYNFILNIVEQVNSGKIAKPDWMLRAEKKEDKYSYKLPTNNFIITAKSAEFEDLAKKIKKFLYSPEHDAEYNG
jgi:hypothetical protein